MTKLLGRGPCGGQIHNSKLKQEANNHKYMKNKIRTCRWTLKLRARLWSWNRLLRSTWSVTGFTSATKKGFPLVDQTETNLPFFCDNITYSKNKVDPWVLSKTEIVDSESGHCLTHPSWTATTDLVQMWQEPPAPCGPTDHWGFWSHMDSISFSAVKRRE